METALRQQNAIINKLINEPERFDFYQAISLLQRQSSIAKNNHELQFKVNPSLAFPVASISKIESCDELDTIVGVNFLGLVGQQGILPNYYTEQLLSLIHNKEFELQDFLDMFHHRLVQLYYQAWEKNYLPNNYRSKPAETMLRSTLGLVAENVHNKMQVFDENLLFYAGFFSQQIRNTNSLCSMLSNYFILPIEIEEFRGQWAILDNMDKTKVAVTNAQFSQLGVNTMLGNRAWNIHNKFRICVGPVNYQQFKRLLPNGNLVSALRSIVKLYVGIDYSFEIQIILTAKSVPYCALGKKKTMLGWNTWLKSKEFLYDAKDAVLN